MGRDFSSLIFLAAFPSGSAVYKLIYHGEPLGEELAERTFPLDLRAIVSVHLFRAARFRGFLSRGSLSVDKLIYPRAQPRGSQTERLEPQPEALTPLIKKG
jgi:hypothetical protein